MSWGNRIKIIRYIGNYTGILDLIIGIWERRKTKMIKLYREEKTIECAQCRKDIFKGSEDKGPGILIIIENDNDEITKVIHSCKGQCDD